MTLRALIWCAVSTTAQTEEEKFSLSAQEAAAQALCEENGWIVIDKLIVPGFSRTYIDIHECAYDMMQDGINAFVRLLELWKTHGFDVLICRDGARFARTQALHAYVVEKTISIGARIYSLSNGWIDKTNYRMFISMDGYKSANDVDQLVSHFKNGMAKQVERGLMTSAAPPMSHVLIRDPDNGKRLRLEVDETKRRLFDDLAALLLSGVPYEYLEEKLFGLGHANPETGRAYAVGTMHRLLHNIYFWGHSGQHYFRKIGEWIYDETAPVPEGVIVYRNTVPAVYTGEQADLVRAELRRRHRNMRPRGRRYTKYAFTGLLMCADCKCRLVVLVDKRVRLDGSRYIGWVCMSRWKKTAPRHGRCNQGRVITDAKVQSYINKLLRLWLSAHPTDFKNLLASLIGGEHATDQLFELQTAIEQVKETIRDLIARQAAAPINIREMYAEQINIQADKLSQLKDDYAKLVKTTEAPSIVAQREETWQELTENGVDWLWQQNPAEINQTLQLLLGKYCFVVDHAEIVGIETPPIWQRR